MKNSKSQRVGKTHPMGRRLNIVASAVASDILSVLKGDEPARLLDCLKKQDYRSVVSASVDPSTFVDAASFRDAYMAVELMSKFPSWDIGVDKTATALLKFHDAELVCKQTNIRIGRELVKVGCAFAPHDPWRLVESARRKINHLLGPFSWDLCEHLFGFGPGATSDIPHRFGDAYFKIRRKPCTTKGNAVLAHTCISRVPMWFSHVAALAGKTPEEMANCTIEEQIALMFTFSEGNRVVTVPKNAKTERTIAIEPTMNSYVQKGIGGLIRSRLRRAGVDLNDQTRNQKFALTGSIDGSIATIDLKAASDSVSLSLVDALLPSDWALALKQCRSPVGVLPDGTKIRYQKISSMGNGYTFELESLIFWALCSAVCSDLNLDRALVSVYGDDLIVPTDAAGPLVELLSFCGFSTNEDKTFIDGPFRESCGKHYFRGTDVTPIYIRKDIDSPERVIWLCNQIRRWSRFSWGLDGRFQPVYEKYRQSLPGSLQKPTIPDGYGDAALFGDFCEATPRRLCYLHKTAGHEGFVGLAHVRVADMREVSDLPYFVRQLATVGRSRLSIEEVLQSRVLPELKKRELVLALPGGVPIPPRVAKWRSVKIACQRWESYGPWLSL